jgi:hypothetical protein
MLSLTEHALIEGKAPLEVVAQERNMVYAVNSQRPKS